MASKATNNAFRYGYGLGPRHSAPSDQELLTAVLKSDRAAENHRLPKIGNSIKLLSSLRQTRKDIRDGRAGAQERYEAVRDEIRLGQADVLRKSFARILDDVVPFRERLMWFWADHFTAVPRGLHAMPLVGPYLDEAIRTNVAGSFADMLKAVVRHPLMLIYLDQAASIGPNSIAGKRRKRGLNENLARELLELHTIGVDGTYTQGDVRELAELLTGLSLDPKSGFIFRPATAEPGSETVLGQRYGGSRRANLSEIDAALDDLAIHPETATHLAQKLARHFIGPRPDPALIDDLATTYRQNETRLMPVYETLLTHPKAAQDLGEKARTPFEFIAGTMVAIGFSGEEIAQLPGREARRFLFRPLAGMGQHFMHPQGPDGWSEDAAHWITPQALATRISWAMAVASETADRAGDPRRFLDRALGDLAGPNLRFAVSAAESRSIGVGMTLASAEFNRR